MPALSNPSLLTIRFDEDGDLTFVVGTKPTQDMLVDSRAVCRASLVFKRMLTGNFAEAKPTFGEWRVRLPEDNADGFAIAMGLAHAQHAHIPPNLSSKALKDVLVVTNKYDMTKILGQMAKTWAKKGSMEVEAVNSVNGWGDILFISWELGSSKVFITASRTLARVCDIDQNGDLVNANGKLLKDRPHILLPNILGLSSIYIASAVLRVLTRSRAHTDPSPENLLDHRRGVSETRHIYDRVHATQQELLLQIQGDPSRSISKRLPQYQTRKDADRSTNSQPLRNVSSVQMRAHTHLQRGPLAGPAQRTSYDDDEGRSHAKGPQRL